MSYFGSLEVYLHFHSFRNIDLFYQGLYQIRTHLYREFPKQEFLVGVPTRITRNSLETIADKKSTGNSDKQYLTQPYIDDRSYTFTSRTFQIKYCDEEVELNEGCVFKFALDLADPATYTAPLIIELDLLFAEAPGSVSSAKRVDETDEKSRKTVFVLATSDIFAVDSPVQGVAEYFQATFDALHCCVLHSTVVSAVVDIRNTPRAYPLRPLMEPRVHRPRQSPSLTYVSESKSGKGSAKSSTNLPTSATVTPKSPESTSPIGSWNRDFPLKKSTCASFVEHITESVRSLDLGLTTTEAGSVSSYDIKTFKDRCDAVYHNYLLLLVRSYYRLRAHATMLSFRSLTEPEASTLDWLSNSRDLYLPGKIAIASKPNGLPQAINVTGDKKKLLFCIPAHLCADVAESVFAGEQETTSIAGAIRMVHVPYIPPSARVPGNPSGKSSSQQAPLETVLQYVMTQDLNLVWRQVLEMWNRHLTLMTFVHKETQFIHQLIWERRMVARYKEVTFLEIMATRNPALPVVPNIGAIHLAIAEKFRDRKGLESVPALPIEGINDTFNIQICPIVFEERISVVPLEVAGKRGYLERRARLSSISGGFADSIPDDPVSRSAKTVTCRYISTHGTPERSSVLDHPDLILSPRSALYNQQYEDFEPLKTLALMAAPSENHDAKACSPSTNADCDSVHEETQFAPDEISLDQEDFRYIKLNCPIFEESSAAPKLYKGSHLIVLVHGFQGNAMDMRTLRNQLSILFPEAIYLSSSSNEAYTESAGLAEMGRRLSDEILTYMKDLCPSEMLGRISFITHSLGGLISRNFVGENCFSARAALPHLETLQEKFHTFLSLSSPHLGYIFAKNRLVDAGLWFLRKWKKSLSLQQVSMGDAKSHRDTLLYRMSLYPELRKFRNVVFVSSPQDQYVPYESARVEISDKIRNDPQWGQIHAEMARNIMNNIKKESLVRLDVSFKIADKSLDTLIGRTAHIQFLGSQQFAQIRRTIPMIANDANTRKRTSAKTKIRKDRAQLREKSRIGSKNHSLEDGNYSGSEDVGAVQQTNREYIGKSDIQYKSKSNYKKYRKVLPRAQYSGPKNYYFRPVRAGQNQTAESAAGYLAHNLTAGGACVTPSASGDLSAGGACVTPSASGDLSDNLTAGVACANLNHDIAKLNSAVHPHASMFAKVDFQQFHKPPRLGSDTQSLIYSLAETSSFAHKRPSTSQEHRSDQTTNSSGRNIAETEVFPIRTPPTETEKASSDYKYTWKRQLMKAKSGAEVGDSSRNATVELKGTWRPMGKSTLTRCVLSESKVAQESKEPGTIYGNINKRATNDGNTNNAVAKRRKKITEESGNRAPTNDSQRVYKRLLSASSARRSGSRKVISITEPAVPTRRKHAVYKNPLGSGLQIQVNDDADVATIVENRKCDIHGWEDISSIDSDFDNVIGLADKIVSGLNCHNENARAVPNQPNVRQAEIFEVRSVGSRHRLRISNNGQFNSRKHNVVINLIVLKS